MKEKKQPQRELCKAMRLQKRGIRFVLPILSHSLVKENEKKGQKKNSVHATMIYRPFSFMSDKRKRNK